MNSAHDRHLAAILGLGLLCGPCLALASDASPVEGYDPYHWAGFISAGW